MPKKRGNNEGSIVRRKDGRWMASITMGRNPETGQLKRAYFYGKTRKLLWGEAYQDQGLVFCRPLGLPLEAADFYNSMFKF